MQLDTVHDVQRAYRSLVRATSFPGTVVSIADEAAKIDLEITLPKPLILLAIMLLDAEVRFAVHDQDQSAHAQYLSQLTYSRIAAVEEAAFVFARVGSSVEAIARARAGTLVDPHLGATVVLQAPFLSAGGRRIGDGAANAGDGSGEPASGGFLELSGPGIRDRTILEVGGPMDWIGARAEKNTEYPLGVDVILYADSGRLVSLPRTTGIGPVGRGSTIDAASAFGQSRGGRLMGYVAVKGGTRAIEASIERLTYERLKRGTVLPADAVRGGMRGLIDQVMSEASLYSESVAAVCIKQAEGSPEEAVFIMRAFRSTLPRVHYSFEMHSESMRIERRISATFKDIPGGQILGASYDYTHRLLDSEIATETEADVEAWLCRWFSRPVETAEPIGTVPKVLDYLRAEGLMKPVDRDDTPPKDVTKEALSFPTARSERLQVLTRGRTGAVTALGYASLRGYGPLLHPTVGELRVGYLPVTIPNPFSTGDQAIGGACATTDADDCATTDADDCAAEDDGYYIGEVRVTEVESVVPVSVPRGEGRTEIEFDIGYGICFGQNETKAIAMSLLDQCLENPDPSHPTHDEEFVLLHIDSVEATGFISHLKLPHYVTFQSELDSVRASRRSKQSSLADREITAPRRGE